MELEAGCVVWSICRLRRYLFSVFFLIFADHECLQQISKMGESNPRIQRWMEFLSAYNYRLPYRRGRDNTNADFLPRLPILPTVEDNSGSSALTDPADLGVYLIRARGYTTPSCPIPGVRLGGLTPPSDNNLGTGWNPSPTWVLGGLTLTKDNFRTHRAPMPLRRRAGPTVDISGSFALTDSADLGVYLIRARGYTTPSCPIPGVGLGGLTPPSDNNLGTGWNPSSTWVLGGLPWTKDDFRTHRASMPLRRGAGPTVDPSVHTTNGPYLSYAIDDQLESSRSTRAGRKRSRTAILTGNTPLRPDYHRAARNGFAAPAAPALPPKIPPRSSPLPRSNRLGSTTPLSRPGLCRPPPAQNSQIDTTPTASHTTTEYDACAATKQLLDTLLSYSHRDWDKAQYADPLCDATALHTTRSPRPSPPLSLQPRALTQEAGHRRHH